MNVKRTAFIMLCAGLFSCGAILAMLSKQEITEWKKKLPESEVQEYLKMSLDELKEKDGEVRFWTDLGVLAKGGPTKKTVTLELLEKLIKLKETKLGKQGHVVEQKKTEGFSKEIDELISDAKRLMDKLSTWKK